MPKPQKKEKALVHKLDDAVETTGTVVGAGGGGLAGAGTGAIIGTAVLPGVGTLIGGAVGAVAGGAAGGALGNLTGKVAVGGRKLLSKGTKAIGLTGSDDKKKKEPSSQQHPSCHGSPALTGHQSGHQRAIEPSAPPSYTMAPPSRPPPPGAQSAPQYQGPPQGSYPACPYPVANAPPPSYEETVTTTTTTTRNLYPSLQ